MEQNEESKSAIKKIPDFEEKNEEAAGMALVPMTYES